jgi:hypothetical protein
MCGPGSFLNQAEFDLAIKIWYFLLKIHNWSEKRLLLSYSARGAVSIQNVAHRAFFFKMWPSGQYESKTPVEDENEIEASCHFQFPEVNFIDILLAVFTFVFPKSAKRHWWLDCLFALFGSSHVKAASLVTSAEDAFSALGCALKEIVLIKLN